MHSFILFFGTLLRCSIYLLCKVVIPTTTHSAAPSPSARIEAELASAPAASSHGLHHEIDHFGHGVNARLEALASFVCPLGHHRQRPALELSSILLQSLHRSLLRLKLDVNVAERFARRLVVPYRDVVHFAARFEFLLEVALLS